MPWRLCLLVLLLAGAGADEAEAALTRLSARCYPEHGLAALPRQGDWIPLAERTDASPWWQDWLTVSHRRQARPAWPAGDTLRRRWHLTEGAIRGSAIHPLAAWLELLTTTPERLDLARLLGAEGRWREALAVLGGLDRRQVTDDSSRLARWRETWAGLLDLQAAATASPLPVLDPPVIAAPAWDRGFPAWLQARDPAPVGDQHLDAARPVLGAEVQLDALPVDGILRLRALRPGTLRWQWRALHAAAPPGAFSPAWLDLPVLEEGMSATPFAVRLAVPACAAPAVLVTAALDDGADLGWAVVHPIPRRITAWCSEGALVVAAATAGTAQPVPCRQPQVTVDGRPLPGHADGRLWVVPLAGTPPACRIAIAHDEATCSLERPVPAPAAWKLAAWWSALRAVPGETVSLAGCARIGDDRSPIPIPGTPGALPIALLSGDGDQRLELGSVPVDALGCFSCPVVLPDWPEGNWQLQLSGHALPLPTPERTAPVGQLIVMPDAADAEPPLRQRPPRTRWTPTPEAGFALWSADAFVLRDPEGLVRAPLLAMGSDGAQLDTAPWTGLPVPAPEAGEGRWSWAWLGFDGRQWLRGAGASDHRPAATRLGVALEADRGRVVVRVTDADGRAVAGARVLLRVGEDLPRNRWGKDTDAYGALMHRDTPPTAERSSREAAVVRTGLVHRWLRASLIAGAPAVADRTWTLSAPEARWSLRRGRCGGCFHHHQEPGTADDPLARWDAWLVTSDDGVIAAPFAWPRPAPEALAILAVAIGRDAIGQAAGVLQGDWSAPQPPQ
jgi:hypothetical protein